MAKELDTNDLGFVYLWLRLALLVLAFWVQLATAQETVVLEETSVASSCFG